jgi:hypothetical protein
MRKDRLSGQVSFFEEAPDVIERPALPDATPMTEKQKLALEKELLRALDDDLVPNSMTMLLAIKVIELMLQDIGAVEPDGRFAATEDELSVVCLQIVSLPDSAWTPCKRLGYSKKELVDAWERVHPGTIDHYKMGETLYFRKGPTV